MNLLSHKILCFYITVFLIIPNYPKGPPGPIYCTSPEAGAVCAGIFCCGLASTVGIVLPGSGQVWGGAVLPGSAGRGIDVCGGAVSASVGGAET